MAPYVMLEADGWYLAPPEHEPTLVGLGPGEVVPVSPADQHQDEMKLVEEMVNRCRLISPAILPAAQRRGTR